MKAQRKINELSMRLHERKEGLLLLLMAVFSKSFLTLVRRHLMSFSFFTTWHDEKVLYVKYFVTKKMHPRKGSAKVIQISEIKKTYFTFTLFFTSSTKVLDGLNDGMLCAGMMMVVFFEMLRPVFWARSFTTKLPNPRRYTFLPSAIEALMLFMKASTARSASALSNPVSSAMFATISAFVISLS